MIHIFDLYESFLAHANTYQGGHVKPQREFINWVRDVSLSFFSAGCQEFEKTKVISDRMSPFLKTKPLQLETEGNPGFDLAVFPEDYAYFATARHFSRDGAFVVEPDQDLLCYDGKQCKCKDKVGASQWVSSITADTIKEKTIDKVDNDRWGSLLDHRILRPSIDKPKMTQYSSGFKVSPKGLGIIVLDYFRLPEDPKMNYIITNSGTEDEYMQFVEQGSQHLPWPKDMMADFIPALILKYQAFIGQKPTNQ